MLYYLPQLSVTSVSNVTVGPILLGMLMAMATAETTTTSPEKTQGLINYLLVEINNLKQEFDEPTDVCKSEVALSENKMNVPKITEQDKCLHTTFDKETCLRRISTGLLEFQVYVKYLHRNFNDKASSKALPVGTRVLFDILHKKVSCPCEITGPAPEVTASIEEKLDALTGWEKKTAMRLILCDLQEFLQYTLRVAHVV
ncbi:interleukin-6-like [Tupaia chinensis]|uniref:interleukin-6-like n=1 Tax=Tupaia chinensis TaxID=246437 RepID=UPI000703EAE3|nr:interleukin-6-like [Tupaia chinensis]